MKHFIAFFAALVFLFPAAAHSESARPPNFVIIVADDLGYGDLAVYGNTKIRTPRIDEMASQGVRLTEFYSISPASTPARAVLLTGRYPRRSGLTRVLVPKEKWGLPASEITVGDALHRQGYTTACIGKWHLGDREPFRPIHHGFDYFFGVLYSNDMSLLPLVKWPRLELWRNEEVVESPVRVSRLTRRYTEEAVDFIGKNREHPFFLYLPHTMPHTPLTPGEGFRGRSKYGAYGDVVEEIDWSTGEVLDALKRYGIDDRTLVIFTSDNGPLVAVKNKGKNTGSAGLLRGVKNTTWEGGVRVPFVARWPGRLPQGEVRGGITSLLDIFPTLVELAGGEPPDDRVIDGKNVMALLEGKQASPHDALYYYYEGRISAVRAGRWKMHLLKRPVGKNGQPRDVQECNPPELYDLVSDPGEKTNVAARHLAVIETMTEMAERFDGAIEPVMNLPSTAVSVVNGLLTQAPRDTEKVPN